MLEEIAKQTGIDIRTIRARYKRGDRGERLSRPLEKQTKVDDKRTYISYKNMIDRCLNPENDSYEYYGGKGIKVCDRWLDGFYNFVEDMGIRPKGMTLDRKESDKDYCKDNCKWSTPTEQVRNRSNTIQITIGGITKPLATWCEEKDLNYEAIATRYRKGIRGAKLFAPVEKRTRGIDFKGETVTFAELGRRYNLDRSSICLRYQKGLRGDDLVKPATC